MRTIPSLTGLRGLAAAWVLLSHLCLVAPAFGAVWLGQAAILSRGWIGVDLFFVLSGFMLMWTHGADLQRPTTAAIGDFACARILRVYPLSLAVLALIVLAAWADPHFVAWSRGWNPGDFSTSSFVRTALLATRWWQGDGGEWNEPVWSLSAELVGYAGFPLLAWLLFRRTRGVAIVVAVASLAILACYQIVSDTMVENAIDQVSALTRMGCCFTAGVALCRVRLALSDRPPRYVSEASLAAALVVAMACHFEKGPVAAPAGFALLIFFLSFRAGALDRLLSSKPLMFLGRISFPLYLVNLTPLLWMYSTYGHAGLNGLAGLGMLVACVLGVVALATLLHHGVEKPSHAWARRKARPAPAHVTPAVLHGGP